MSSNFDNTNNNSKSNHSSAPGNNNTDTADNATRKTRSTATLKIAEVAEQRDIGRKIARIDPDIVERLNISSGDVLELSSVGKKTTVLSWPAREGDRRKGLIRIDGYTRNKLDVGINDTVEIKKVKAKESQTITLAPIELLRIMGAEDYLLGVLEGQLGTRGDTIPLNIMRQRIDLVIISTAPR